MNKLFLNNSSYWLINDIISDTQFADYLYISRFSPYFIYTGPKFRKTTIRGIKL